MNIENFTFSTNRFYKTGLVGVVLFLYLFIGTASAEGSMQLSPTEDDWVILNFKNGFASYGSAGTNKAIGIEIMDSSEEVYIALSRLAYGDSRNLANSTYDFRIKDSIGNIVHGPFTVSPANANGDVYNDVVAGPNLGSGTGYDISDPAFHFSPNYAGTFYLEFNLTSTFNSFGFINEGPAWWDFTVTDAGGNIKTGRLWSKNWAFRTPCNACSDIFSQPLNGEVFVLTNDGFVHYINFKDSGFRGLSFALAFNSTGPGDTGDILADRRSVNALDASNPEFQIFLSDPDPNLYEEPTIGSLLNGPDLANAGQCDTATVLCFAFEISQPGQIELTLDFDKRDGIYTPGTADLVILSHNQKTAGLFDVCITWDRRDGLGRPIDLTAYLPTIVTYTQGVINFMFYDVEYNNPGFTVEVIHPTSAIINSDLLFYDDSQLAPTDSDANLDQDNNAATGITPPLIESNGCTTPCHTWNRNTSSTSLGYGESNTINSWWSGNVNYLNLLARPICRGDTVSVPKTVGDVKNSTSGNPNHFEVTFEIIIENTGTTSFDSIQLTDDLAANFGAGLIGVISPPAVSVLSGNPELPTIGNFPNDIFDGISGLLDPNDAIKVEFTLELDPSAGGGWDSYDNQAYFFATNEFSNTISVLTTDPDNPDPNSPTKVILPKIGLAKSISEVNPASSGEPNRFDVLYELVIENIGSTPLSNLSLSDSLANQMGAAFIKIVDIPTILPTSTATIPGGINSGFDGTIQTEMLDNNGTLEPGEQLIVNFTAEISPYEAGTRYDSSGYLANQASVSGIYKSSVVSDWSDTGIDPKNDLLPSGSNPGVFGDTGGSDDPTIFIFEQCPAGVVIGQPNPFLDCNAGNCVFVVSLSGDCALGLSVQNPQPGHSYEWFDFNQLIVGETTDALPPSVLGSGLHEVRVEVTNNAGCIRSDTLSLSCCSTQAPKSTQQPPK